MQDTLEQRLKELEDKIANTEIENRDLIEQSILDPNKTAQPVASRIAGPSYEYIWNRETNEKVKVLYYLKGKKLLQRNKDGSLQFTDRDPGKPVKRGTLKCLLHKDSEQREHYDTLGLRTCPKSNISNPHQLRMHMTKKHPQEWKAIEEERVEKERQEDRAFQKSLYEVVASKAVPVVKEKSIELVEEPVANRLLGDKEYLCPECNKVHRTTSKLGKKHLKLIK